MKVTILQEEGYEWALLGLSLSYNQPPDKMHKVARRLCSKNGGHNKFLESVVVWLDVTGPRFWWCQLDTYRIGVTKQSESTMHTLTKRPLTKYDFSRNLPAQTLNRLNGLINDGAFDQLKGELPEGFLQRRIICTNYKALRHIIGQRKDHRLSEWREFIDQLVSQLDHPEFVEDLL